jgi:hypothetical protein
MIPALKTGQATSSPYLEFVSELRLRGFEGDVSTSYADRTVLATDNSISLRLERCELKHPADQWGPGPMIVSARDESTIAARLRFASAR